METREADLRARTHPVTPTDLHTTMPAVEAAPAATPPEPGRAPARPHPSEPRTLAERIADTEREVIEHDEALRHGVDDLRSNAREAVRSQARTGMMIGAGALALGLVLWKSGRSSRHAPVRTIGRHAEARRPHRQSRAKPLMRLLARLLPLLVPVVAPLASTRLRQTVGPRAAALVMAMALPMVTRAAGTIAPPVATHGGGGEDPRTVPLLDLDRYAGDWYEVARLPTALERGCSRDASTRYTLRGDDTLVVTNRCVQDDGSVEAVTGIAQQPDPAAPGKLKLSFAPDMLRWLPFTWADYWVLHVDDDYSHAVVGTPERDHLWLLSRTPRMDDTTFHRLASLAAGQGYEVHRLRRTVQTSL
ncbi:lipocalin family protein [Caldimonas tepidiphila]|uniref:lipocalin family protein n=1 Tax=Caldimonas tepidiphila TaxID=2315841 RepID=UPI000E5A396F|nr:lipocalin family protein [Caldimonas tepidiphila]